MTVLKKKSRPEPWENELLAMHRWGRSAFWFKVDDNRGKEEHARLKTLWNKARPLDASSGRILEQIMSLEICNWKLEEGIIALCRAIGSKKPAVIPIGHMNSMTRERWYKIWAYYLALRNWRPGEIPAGYNALLEAVDPDRSIQNHVYALLGKRDAVKEAYVERFCLCLGFWLKGLPPEKSPPKIAHAAAVAGIEARMKKLDPQSKVLFKGLLNGEGNGRLNPCSHKLFYRYDLIISSIGAKKWRGAMGRRATDGFMRTALLEKYLAPIETWLKGGKIRRIKETKISQNIHKALGKPDDRKLFLLSLLVSLLRSQQRAAQMLAESRMKK